MSNLLAVIGVGFLLGVRHATDPDHVVAVSTIVSRQRSIGQASLIGALWGLGHTITIFFVGVAIILFNLVIPPRVGLAMELAVGLMLIFLGVLNLTGIMQWITNRFTPDHTHGNVIHSHGHQHGDVYHEHFHSHGPDVSIPLDQRSKGSFQNALQRVGLYQLVRPFAVGLVHGLAGSAGRCFACPDCDSRFSLGDDVSSGFWVRNNRRDDADYDDYWGTLRVYRQAICSFKSWTRVRFGAGQHSFRSVSYLSDWLC